MQMPKYEKNVSFGNLHYIKKESIWYNTYENDGLTRITARKENYIMKKWLVGGYLLAFIGGIIWFWVASDNLDALGFCLLYFFILLPVATILVSFFIGKNNIFGKGKWLAAAVFGLLYMLSEYATISMVNNVAFHKINAPDFSMILSGLIMSVLGIFGGKAVTYLQEKKKI